MTRLGDRGLRDRHRRRRPHRARRRPHRRRATASSTRSAPARRRRPTATRSASTAAAARHARPRQLPPPPLPVGHARARAGRHAVRVAAGALSGLGARRRRDRAAPPPAPGSPRSRARAARPRPTTTTSSRATRGDLLAVEIEAAREVGLRFHPCRGSMDLGRSDGGLPPDEVVEDRDAILAACEAAIDRYHDTSPDAMVRIALAPCSPFSVTQELMRESAELARARGVRLHTHMAETEDEERFCLELFGCRPVEYLERLGWLGDDVWLAHCVHLDEHEVRRFGETGTGVAHCPSSNARLGAGIAPVPALIGAGAPVGLGVDGAASNEAGELGGELRQALLARAAGRRGPRGADRRARRSSWARSTAPAASAARPRSARWSPASSPTSRCGGSTASTTRGSPTRSPRSCSARARWWTRCWSAAAWSSRGGELRTFDEGVAARDLARPVAPAGAAARGWRHEHDHRDPRRRRRRASAAPTASRRSRASSPTPPTRGPTGCCGAPRCAPRTRARGSASIEIGAALRVPGVHAVLTHEDVPGRKTYGLEIQDQPVLAWEDVRYQGEPIALVAADHPETARAAADEDRGRLRGARAADRPRARARPDRRRRCTRAATCCATCRSATATRTPRARSWSPASTRSACRTRRSSGRSPASPCRPRTAAWTSTSPPSGCTSTATSSPPRSTCRRRRCGSCSAASAARSAAARTSRCRSTRACSRCTPTGR